MLVQKFVKKISKKKCIVWGTIGVASIVLILIVFVGLGIYTFGWEGNFFVRNFAKIIPYPVLRINGDFILFSEYQRDVETLVRFYNHESVVGGLPIPNQETIRANVLERLKRNKIIEQIAEKEEISVSKEELDKEFYKIMVQAGSEEAVEKTLKDLYGWSEKKFKERIVKNIILQEKLKARLGVGTDLDIAIDKGLEGARVSEYIRKK